MKIYFAEKKIEITKTFAHKASCFGTGEYKALRAAINDLPDFQVVIKEPIVHRTYMRGLTYEFMEQCISRSDVDGSLMEEFQAMRWRGYSIAKHWFLNKFPEINYKAA
jgi:hypothetical protein